MSNKPDQRFIDTCKEILAKEVINCPDSSCVACPYTYEVKVGNLPKKSRTSCMDYFDFAEAPKEAREWFKNWLKKYTGEPEQAEFEF